jgi:multidrug resistance efflux pump
MLSVYSSPRLSYRRYGQGKRFGHELNIYSVWYELRYGITTCLMLTVLLITLVFYHHPSTSNVVGNFRAVPMVPEINGRVAEVYVGVSADVKQRASFFKLDSAKQEAALEVAKRNIAEIEAKMTTARAEITAADGRAREARGTYEQAVDELKTKQQIAQVVARREIERREKLVQSRLGTLNAATANREVAQMKLSTQLPAERASAEALQKQAMVDLSKTVIHAGIYGRVEQFVLRVGDVVNPLMRGQPIPVGVGGRLIGGFGQIEAQVIKHGMIAEATCVSKPLTIIPMVVTQVQDYVAAGQIRSAQQLIDVQQMARPGTLTVYLEPLYQKGPDGVTAGSSCIANIYTNNHAVLQERGLGSLKRLALHAIDTIGIVHAMILRLQALVLPIKVLIGAAH